MTYEDRVAANRRLGLRINQEIWNERRLDRIPEYFAEDFVAEYPPNIVRRGRDEVAGMVERSHAAFEGFRETVRTIVADDQRIVVHFTITGRQTGQWGTVAPTGREVEYDEIVIMTVKNGKVVHQLGVVDNLTALKQIGVIPSRQ